MFRLFGNWIACLIDAIPNSLNPVTKFENRSFKFVLDPHDFDLLKII